jgi:hypothetical protein
MCLLTHGNIVTMSLGVVIGVVNGRAKDKATTQS